MDYIIDKSVIGHTKHLLCKDGEYSFVDDVDSSVMRVSKDSRHFEELVKLSLRQVSLDPPERFTKMMSSFRELQGASNLPWKSIMPTTAYRSFVDELTNVVDGFLSDAPVKYIEGTWDRAGVVFNNLKQVRVNKRELKRLIDAKEGNVHALLSFVPTEGNLARPVVYDRLSTSTGRLNVKSGPQVLTLKREHRKQVIESVYGDDGEITCIDFNALEPRVLLYEAGQKCEGDLYIALARALKDDANVSCTRNQSKGACICEMYGAGTDVLRDALQCREEQIDEASRAVKRFFGSRNVAKRVKQEFVRDGYVTSRFGRRITVDEPKDHVILNHFVQSTGVDVSLLAFSDITEKLKVSAPRVRPLFMVHDALFLDAPKEDVSKIDELLTVKVHTYVQRFYLKRTIV